ncbi:TetR/AcrR family transcriptional regulator [Gordonia shandongensis]|uniref:TetR/AcrR family transcriptional regulator n=1 Tax=Gordonia shandongensis TaxID=376351 RepID=UPI0004001C8B|nr:TetR/AcrR family transcriptional regulator C-terminal domain-containing protein [Gordonia shandongensis]
MPDNHDDRSERARQRHDLLWTGRQRGSRGPRPGLDLADIIRAGIGIADAEGLSALSMNRLARELGSGVMTLYRYVPGKGELVDLMADAVVAQTVYPPAAEFEDWRSRLAFTARQEWTRYRDHPWLLGVMASTKLPMGPGTTAEVDWSLSSVNDLPLSASHKLWMVMTVSAFVQGAAMVAISDEADDDVAAGLDGIGPAGHEALTSIGADTLAQLTTELTGPPDLDAWFEFGLERTLDGLAQFLGRDHP